MGEVGDLFVSFKGVSVLKMSSILVDFYFFRMFWSNDGFVNLCLSLNFMNLVLNAFLQFLTKSSIFVNWLHSAFKVLEIANKLLHVRVGEFPLHTKASSRDRQVVLLEVVRGIIQFILRYLENLALDLFLLSGSLIKSVVVYVSLDSDFELV